MGLPDTRIGTKSAAWTRDFVTGGDKQSDPPYNDPNWSRGSYAYNGWFVYTRRKPGVTGTGNTSGDNLINAIKSTDRSGVIDSLFFGKIARADDPVNVPVIGDGIWSESFAYEGKGGVPTLKAPVEDFPWPFAYDGGANGGPISHINRYHIDRHNGGINMAFVDGHAENISNLNHIWRLRHHDSWDFSFVDPNIVSEW